MRSLNYYTIAVFCAALLSTGFASADDFDKCNEGSGQPSIDACSRLIDSHKLNDHDLSIAYYNRGSEKDDLGDEDGSIADLDMAIKIRPDYVSAFINRGIAKGKKGKLDDAIADFNKAIAIDPKNGNAYHNRGYAKKLKGDKKGAEEDFALSESLKGKQGDDKKQ